MAVPTLITDLSTTAASNSPAAGDNVFPDLDDFIRFHSAAIASIAANSGNGWTSPYSTAANPTFTGVALFPDGSASAPSISNTGDTNTGVYFPAADTVAVTTGGTEAARINSSGNVGIGTSSPTQKLDVRGDVYIASTNARVYVDNGGAGGSSVQIGVSGTSHGYVGTDGLFPLVFQPNNTERMRIDSSGNVGIGNTPSGSYKLEVTGAGYYSGALTVGGALNVSGTSTFVAVIPAADLTYGLGSSVRQWSEVATESVFCQSGDLSLRSTNGAVKLKGGLTTYASLRANGAFNFAPQTTPASAAAGDVYYDSGTNKLRCYNGASWNDLF